MIFFRTDYREGQLEAAIIVVRLLHNVKNARSFVVSSGDIEHIA